MPVIRTLLAAVCLAVSACNVRAEKASAPEITPPKLAVSVFSGPRTGQEQFANADRLLRRLETDGWFVLASAPAQLNMDTCKNISRDGEMACRNALRQLEDAANPASIPDIAFVFTAARNQLANLQCLGAGRYRISQRQSMLADYRLALSEGDKAEAERARIASCLLSASREFYLETNRHEDNIACSPRSLEGEWRSNDGLVIRFEGPFRGPFSKTGEGQAVIVRPGRMPGGTGLVMYTKVRGAADCSFLVTRHLWLDLKLHASPPHIVELKLDRISGTLTDEYQGSNTDIYTRLAGPLPLKR